MKKLPLSYYQQTDVVALARDMIGKLLCTEINGVFTSGIITETEAYNGRCDAACHAYKRRTKRTEIMYQNGGLAYVYLCYGIHSLFNITTNAEEMADAILIRAIEPVSGVEHMMERRNKTSVNKSLSSGPGSLSKAMGIELAHNGEKLDGNSIWLEEYRTIESADEIVSTTRIGIDYAGEDALLPWRFYLKNTPYISKK